jgi:vancomycin resistance protein YoaR
MRGDGRIEAPLASVEPKLSTERAERLRPTELLSSYQTNYFTYDDDPGRVANLQTASEAVNGTFVAPGEVFSFNELAAPLEYEESKVIIEGRVDYADGGGLCQVSSTLYMAANMAGMETVERHPHHAELPYIRPGFDATIWFAREMGTPLDMKFENTSPGYIYVQQWVDTTTGNVHAAIYGQPNGVAVNMDSERIARYKDENKKPVTEWITYKTVTQNGQVVRDGPLHTDTYRYLEEAETAGTA